MTASFAPSLKHMLLARIAVTICSDPEIRHCINEMDYLEYKNAKEGRWKRLMDMATEKVSDLQVPPRLQQSILALIKPISLEIAKFKHDHLKLLEGGFDFRRCRLFWRPEGILDRQKIAVILTRDEHIYIMDRLTLAIRYFLETDARELVKLLSPSVICTYNNRIPLFQLIRDYNNRPNIAQHSVMSLYPWKFDNDSQNHLWVRYFFDKLTPTEKKKWIEFTVKKIPNDQDNFRFCVSQLNEEQREPVFKKKPRRLLRFLINWPYQSLFLEAAEQMWKYLQERDFRYLLYFIIYNRIAADWYDFDYINLLKDFWQQSPVHLKDYVRNDSIYEPVKMVISHDFSKLFPKEEIIRTSFHVEPPNGRSVLREGDLFPLH